MSPDTAGESSTLCSDAVTTFARVSQFLEISPNRLLQGLDEPDPQRTARIKKAMARKRAPVRRKP